MSDHPALWYWDITKTGKAKHHSGIKQVSRRLSEALEDCQPVTWHPQTGHYRSTHTTQPIRFAPQDHLITAEVFAFQERKNYAEWFNKDTPFRTAIFHDAIPLQHPEFTWPHSVARHPFYMKELARYEHVAAVSRASKQILEDYWEWLGLNHKPYTSILPPGANGRNTPRRTDPSLPQGPPHIVMIGILEPRKNQETALAACHILHQQGIPFHMHIVGRLNPHFGKPILATIKKSARAGLPVTHHKNLSDHELDTLLTKASFTLFPSRAEGNGLPVLESLWAGLPVITSDIPAATEWTGITNAVIQKPCEDADALSQAMHRWLTDENELHKARTAACQAPLPTWEQASASLREACQQAQKEQRRGKA